MVKRNQPYEFVLTGFKNTDNVSHQNFLFDHIYLSMLLKMTFFVITVTVEYNAAASLNIRINIKLSISFSHSWKTYSFLTYAIPRHTHAEVDFEVISVPVNI